MEYVNKVYLGDWIETLKELPDGIFHCVVTSPPYWGQRDYGVKGQMGLEKTPEEHIEKLKDNKVGWMFLSSKEKKCIKQANAKGMIENLLFGGD